jgi:wyosine [tRNA(Phe)-imidazoG37] synthetase (radical SAM superfamily)
MTGGKDANDELPIVRDHRRQWRDCLYVYPVIARRSRGLSIGVNLNPEKRCTFSCVYCQVDRRSRRELHSVDIETLRRELDLAIAEALGGGLWREERFAATPPELRRVNDIAFSGDGEPTCLANFGQAVQAAAEARRQARLESLKLIVITNASSLDQPQVAASLPILDANNGEIWAKLDAGTEAAFRRINRPKSPISLEEIVANITEIARGRPVVIQSMFFRAAGQAPPAEEVAAYCRRLQEIIQGGGRIKLIQVYSVARVPAEKNVSALSAEELEAICRVVRRALPGVAVESY